MAKGAPKPGVKRSVEALVRGAAAGQVDLAWLDRAIREAGYVRKGERATKGEIEEALRAAVRVIEDVGLECAGTCGEHWLDRVARGIEALQNAAGDDEKAGTAKRGNDPGTTGSAGQGPAAPAGA